MSCTLTGQQKSYRKLTKNRLFSGYIVAGVQYLLIRQLQKLSLAVFATPIIFLLSAQLLAGEYECHSGQQTRLIRIDYPGYEHLCEVSVTRLGQQREVKWYADSDSTFCSNKIIELVGKHQNEWGFSCERQPDHDGINELNLRRALLEPSTTTKNNSVADLLAIQLFMARLASVEPQASTANGSGSTLSNGQNGPQDNTATLANRVILYADDGENYNTLATLDILMVISMSAR